MFSRKLCAVSCFLLLVLIGGSSEATIHVSGDWAPGVNPDSQYLWNLADHLYVGQTGSGDLRVADGADVTNYYGVVGVQAGSIGSVTVTDIGSLWQSLGSTAIGQSGTGSLMVVEGGRVISPSAHVGYASTGDGSVTISDTSSRWDITQTLTIGTLGTADMSIQAGGRVISGQAVLGEVEGAVGQISVSGSGSIFAATGYEDKSLTIGDAGQGSLQIADGAVVVSGKGYIGKQSSGVGSVSLTGNDTRWSNHAGGLYIGGDENAAAGQALLAIGAGASVDADEVTVWQTGTVQGAGTLTTRDTMTVHGSLKPGNGIGTLTINGDLVMESDGVIEIELNNSGQSDCITVTDGLTLHGGTLKAISTETITDAHVYTVMEAEHIDGRFDVLDTALLNTSVVDEDPTLAYEDQAVRLRVSARPFTDTSLTRTANQSAVGSALQTIADGGGNQLTTELQQLGEDRDVREAYDQLSGQNHLGVAPVTSASTDRFQGLASNRLSQVRSYSRHGNSPMLAWNETGQASGTDSIYDVHPLGSVFAMGQGTALFGDQPWGFWGKVYGLLGDRESHPDALGYGYEVLGGGLGIDYQFSDSWLLGVTGGFSEGDIDYSNASHTQFDGTYVGLYSTWDQEIWYVDSILTLAHMDYNTQRIVTVGGPHTLTGLFDGREINASIEAGCDWPYTRHWQVQPYVGLSLSHVTLDDYTESGGSGALTYGCQHYTSVRGSLGVKLQRTLWAADKFGHTKMQVRTRWDHEFNDNQSTVDASFASDPGAVFTVTDRNRTRDSGVLGVGLHVLVSDNAQLRLDYDTRISNGDQAHLVTGQVEVRW